MKLSGIGTRIFQIVTAVLFSISILHAQCDYVTPRYEVQVEENVFFGVDTTFDGMVDSLFLNIYKPINDNPERPMAIWCFGGGFFAGEKESFNDVCAEMAARGYVAVTTDYRLGYANPNFLPYPFAYDDRELVRAGYRAMQDLKGAIRFMKERHLQDSIDLNNVFCGGGSAGAITALAATFLDDPAEKDSTLVGNISRVNTLNPVDRPDLGPIEGRLHVGAFDATVKGVINIFGALLDTANITADDDEVIYSYHQTGDPVVPCEYRKAYHGFPLVPDNMPFGYGSCKIEEHFENLGRPSDDFDTWIFNGNEHAIHDEEALFVEVFDFLQYHICGQLVAVTDHKEPSLEVLPNPADDKIVLNGLEESTTGWLIDELGRVIESQVISEQAEWSVDHLSPGIYILQFENGQHSRFIKR